MAIEYQGIYSWRPVDTDPNAWSIVFGRQHVGTITYSEQTGMYHAVVNVGGQLVDGEHVPAFDEAFFQGAQAHCMGGSRVSEGEEPH